MGQRLRLCWDCGAVGRLVHGLRREDAGAVWAAEHDLQPPSARRGGLDLFDLDGENGASVRSDGHLSREWVDGRWARDLDAAAEWARLVLEVQARQERRLRQLADPRATPIHPPLAVLTAYAESAAALLAVELERHGLPVDREIAEQLLTSLIGPPAASPQEELDRRAERNSRVLQHFPGAPVDLRNPAQVRVLLNRIGLDLPDTRSWRLEPHAASHPAVAALLAWRKQERLATTYGWQWLAEQVGRDGRLRGRWSAADAAAGRMTAQAGLHNLPAELRPAVRAETGQILVRADLGQVEPRVLAAVSLDDGLIRAARQHDMYAPVADELRCDRPTAKVAVLAAMYGQTSGAAGAALRTMDRTYPRAMAYLRHAEECGRTRVDLRTYGGRLLRLAPDTASSSSGDDRVNSAGRFARNAVIQGAAAELFKAWAAAARNELTTLGGQIVLCLHDELLVSVPRQNADAARGVLVRSLDATTGRWAAGSGVRFVVDVSVGASWTDAHD